MAANRFRSFVLTALALAGAAIVILSFLPWINFHWLNEDCPACGVGGVYLIDYADRGSEVNGVTGFGDGFVVAGCGLVIVLLAVVAIRFRKRSLLPLFGIAIAGSVATAITVYDAIKQWTFIEWMGPLPVGTGYPRLISFETQPVPALYAEIALGVLILLSAVALIGSAVLSRTGSAIRDVWTDTGEAWA